MRFTVFLAFAGLTFSQVTGADHPSSVQQAQTRANWVQFLDRPKIKYKGFDPCTHAKGVCIEDDFQPAAFTQVRFAVDSAYIESRYNSALNALGEALQHELADAVLLIEGHTDSTGSVVYNQELSERRADSVAIYLQYRFSIRLERLRTVGYGELRPMADNDSADGRQQNRRVVFVRQGTWMGR
jgi:outer membrane protein OmpA-like peptidoglycan-associated protein